MASRKFKPAGCLVPCEGFAGDERNYSFLSHEFDTVENVEGYQTGGFHPIDLGDQLGDRFTVIHKLGAGGGSTVWLAIDAMGSSQKYVSIKVVKADTSERAMATDLKIRRHIRERQDEAGGGEFIDIPLGQFWITGVNGLHLCIVSRFAGPSIAQLGRGWLRENGAAPLSPKTARRVATQVLQTVSYLHSEEIGVVHGDLTSANVLCELNSAYLDSWSQEEIMKILGKPVRAKIKPSATNQDLSKAPEYIYLGANMLRLLPYCTGNIKLIDFGTSYLANQQAETLYTAYSSCPPEFLIQERFDGKKSDMWAVGHLIWQLRAGELLFRGMLGDPREIAWKIEKLLGAWPSPSTSTEDTAENGADLQHGVKGDIADITLVASEKGNLKETVRAMTNGKNDLKPFASEERGSAFVSIPLIVGNSISSLVSLETKISEHEADVLIDLFRKVWNYDIDKRWSASRLLCHPWFSEDFETGTWAHKLYGGSVGKLWG